MYITCVKSKFHVSYDSLYKVHSEMDVAVLLSHKAEQSSTAPGSRVDDNSGPTPDGNIANILIRQGAFYGSCFHHTGASLFLLPSVNLNFDGSSVLSALHALLSETPKRLAIDVLRNPCWRSDTLCLGNTQRRSFGGGAVASFLYVKISKFLAMHWRLL